MLSRQSEGTYERDTLSCNSSGTLSHACLSSLSHCGLILAQKWNWCAQADFHLLKKEEEKKEAQIIQPSPKVLAK